VNENFLVFEKAEKMSIIYYLYSIGEMLWSQRVTKKLSCPKVEGGNEMTCSMELESFGYTADEILYVN
jgi:hypothetical protein